jgi:hypothetical protein
MPNTPMSDCYSFAIIAHELLAFCHPFVGDVVIEGKHSIDEAMRGLLPWIDDQKILSIDLQDAIMIVSLQHQELGSCLSKHLKPGKRILWKGQLCTNG